MYQQKCPIYQNSKAVRDMVLLLMLLGMYLLIAQSLLTESSKISCPESCFFLDPSEVPL